MRKESDFSTPLLNELPDEDRGGQLRSHRCMGIGTGGVVCQERAVDGSLYCRHCDPQKKLREKRAVYDRLWNSLIPMPNELQPELADGHHAELAQIWAKIQSADPPSGFDADLWRRKTYLEQAIDWADSNMPRQWSKVEILEDEIQELEETVEADSLVEAFSVSTDEMVNPVYPRLPHEVTKPSASARRTTRVYTCHAPGGTP